MPQVKCKAEYTWANEIVSKTIAKFNELTETVLSTLEPHPKSKYFAMRRGNWWQYIMEANDYVTNLLKKAKATLNFKKNQGL